MNHKKIFFGLVLLSFSSVAAMEEEEEEKYENYEQDDEMTAFTGIAATLSKYAKSYQRSSPSIANACNFLRENETLMLDIIDAEDPALQELCQDLETNITRVANPRPITYWCFYNFHDVGNTKYARLRDFFYQRITNGNPSTQ